MKEGNNLFLVFVDGDIEPQVRGPYETPEHREAAALDLRKKYGRDGGGIFMLDADPSKELPEMDSFGSEFFAEVDREAGEDDNGA